MNRDEAGLARCVLCGEPIDDSRRNVYFVVTGFERDRGAAGGTHALRCRKRSGEVAHALCVNREAQGLPAMQETLL